MHESARAGRLAVLALALVLALVLAACAGPQGPRIGRGATDARGAGTGADAPAPAGAARKGGYYLDDGPGANAPADLAAIPDAVPRAEPLKPATMQPYSVFGRRYTPMTRVEHYRERGVASWYGRRYHGQPTSSGEPYDMYAMTAAHPTLPIPSYARVTRTGDGRSVVVRVNDRGPFLQNRVIDLSYTAAAKLGFVEAGSAEVEVELVTRFDDARPAASAAAAPLPAGAPAPAPAFASAPASASAPAPASAPASASAPAHAVEPAAGPGNMPLAAAAAERVAEPRVAEPAAAEPSAAFWLQLGAFTSLDGARGAMQAYARRLDGLGAALDIRREGALYKVQAGPWPQREQAVAAAERIRAATGLQSFATLR